MSKHIAFFNYPAHGHINPTLPVVEELVGRGHRVTYVVAEQFAGSVAAVGAEPMTYPSLAPKDWNTIAIPATITGDDIAEATLAHFQEAIAPLTDAEKRLGDDRPDVMVYDAFGYASGRLLSRKWGIPSLLTATTFVSSATFSPYAKLAGRMPAIDPDHPKLREYADLLRATLDAHGMADLAADEFTGAVEKATMVFVPGEFQPGTETFDDSFTFVGPCLGGRSLQGGWTPPANGRPVLLVALGSFGYERQADFYRSCVEAFADLPWHVVMSLGGLVSAADLGPLPDHIEAHPWVPQLEVLEHAAAFVSHAGMGSTMESLAYGIPPVVVPHTAEQELIGERLAELGLGRVIAPAEVTAEALRTAVTEQYADPAADERATAFASRIGHTGGPRAAADVVESRIGAVA